MKPRTFDDEGSMPMAMLVVLVAMSLTAALVPMVVNQIVGTRTVGARTVALDSAQAGIDAAVGQLRSAVQKVTNPDGTESITGTVANLPPCELTGAVPATSLLGLALSTADTQTIKYRVKLQYFGLPENATDDTPVELPCPPTDVPQTAVMTATGASVPADDPPTEGSSGTRTIQATYTFKINNENIDGGAIQLAAPTTDPLCIDGGADASPATNAPANVQLCPEGGTSEQRFVYTSDLNVMLVGSATSLAPTGMCLQADYSSGAAVTFQPCAGRTPKQQWSLDNNSRLQATPNGTSLPGTYCLNAKNAGAVGPLVMGACNTGSNKSVWRMQTSVGAGMASAATHQLVNYKQFSRCLDVTNHNPGFKYMIVWFCKQAPDGNVSWNQQWSLPTSAISLATAVPERIRTYGSGNPGYCLRSPGNTTSYVTMSACAATGTLTDAALKWTVYGDTGNYATSYRIVDSNGLCLTPTDLTVANPDTHTDGTATVKVAACTSSELQKWNAPANFNKPLAITNTQEK
ncbi:ricin-type beta-trefoil lectin domain protein [Symbioplanes lichenis]|uniref:ricin-type beta-trefoil lectin domain protein n=1 Tax=Symbioplanes lichenis TaxID=1629072 RepID=UPI0027385774|nr:ricin-type beta-trefoil lectin domain protein [Actinoplanes lichenis]